MLWLSQQRNRELRPKDFPHHACVGGNVGGGVGANVGGTGVGAGVTIAVPRLCVVRSIINCIRQPARRVSIL